MRTPHVDLVHQFLEEAALVARAHQIRQRHGHMVDGSGAFGTGKEGYFSTTVFFLLDFI